MDAVTAATVAPVVVGVDHSELSLVATRLAAREAALRDRPLRVVHAFNWSATATRPGGELRGPAEQLTARAAAVAAADVPELAVTEILAEGPTIATLLRESSGAALLVLGDGGLNDCTCVLADTTAVQVAARAGCSVLVARELAVPEGGVLAAIDGTSSSAGVLEVAFDTASRRGGDVTVVQVMETGNPHRGNIPQRLVPDPAATDRLAGLVAPWRRRHPAVPVVQELLIGDPASLLIERSTTAEVVVVGARGADPWRSGLGEISQSLLHHAPVPVIVVHTTHELYVQQ